MPLLCSAHDLHRLRGASRAEPPLALPHSPIFTRESTGQALSTGSAIVEISARRCVRCKAKRKAEESKAKTRSLRKEAHAAVAYTRHDSRWPYPRVRDVDALVKLFRRAPAEFHDMLVTVGLKRSKSVAPRGEDGASWTLSDEFAFLADPPVVLELLRKDSDCFKASASVGAGGCLRRTQALGRGGPSAWASHMGRFGGVGGVVGGRGKASSALT